MDTMQLGSMAGLTALTMYIGQDKANKIVEKQTTIHTYICIKLTQAKLSQAKIILPRPVITAAIR